MAQSFGKYIKSGQLSIEAQKLRPIYATNEPHIVRAKLLHCVLCNTLVTQKGDAINIIAFPVVQPKLLHDGVIEKKTLNKRLFRERSMRTAYNLIHHTNAALNPQLTLVSTVSPA
jgi:hypothetical protein